MRDMVKGISKVTIKEVKKGDFITYKMDYRRARIFEVLKIIDCETSIILKLIDNDQGTFRSDCKAKNEIAYRLEVKA